MGVSSDTKPVIVSATDVHASYDGAVLVGAPRLCTAGQLFGLRSACHRLNHPSHLPPAERTTNWQQLLSNFSAIQYQAQYVQYLQ